MKHFCPIFAAIIFMSISLSSNAIILSEISAHDTIVNPFYLLEIDLTGQQETEKSATALSVPVNTQDSLALIDLYNSTNGANWISNAGWLNYPVRIWVGITVENGRVTKIELDDNNLTGTIPASIGNLTALTSLDLSENNLSGDIPPEIGNLVHLEGNLRRAGLLTYIYDHGLDLSENNLTGPIPPEIGNLANLKELRLNNNNLNGEIPQEVSLLKKSYFLYLQANNLTGGISTSIADMDQLVMLNLGGNYLTGGIPAELGSLDSLTAIGISQNNLEGEVPSALFSKGRLVMILLDGNNFSGALPASMSQCRFGYLVLSGNDFNYLPDIPIYPDFPMLMTTFALDSNKFDFSDLEQFAQKEIDILNYSPQQKLKLEKSVSGENITLKMDAGGTQTTYQWYYDSVAIANAKEKEYLVDLKKDLVKYHCEAKNSSLPDLTLLGSVAEEGKDCWEIGSLVFCLNQGKWEKGDKKNEIKSTDQVSVNNFLFFDGALTIDTAALEITADGEFYIKDIPIPGGSIGKYSIGTGEYSLKLMGEDGKITDFMNSYLEQSPELFGVELKVDNLELVGGRNASGIKMVCTIKIPGIAGGCDDSDDATTEIKLDGLEITYNGISLSGVDIKDLGLYFDDYCLKNLVVNYDSQKDILVSGAQLAFPFGEVGGGIKLEEGLIDSLAWNIEASTPPFVLGSTTVGIKGFFGHISNITKPAIEIELGGIFSDILSDDLYRVTASGKTVWPTYFEVKGTGQFLRPILDDLPYQLNGEVALSYDIPNELFKVDFLGKAGTMDEETWLISGNGDFKICHRYDPPKFSGRLNGTLTLPKLSEEFPYSWLGSMDVFPLLLQSTNRFIWGNNKLIYGSTEFSTDDYGPYRINYVVDLEKTPEDPDYIYFTLDKESKKSAILATKSGSSSKEESQEVVIPENVEFAVIAVSGKSETPVTSLISPKAVSYSESSSENNILKSQAAGFSEVFWTVFDPDPGTWQVVINNPESADSLYYWFQYKEKEFEVSVDQSGSTVIVNWDAGLAVSGSTVDILLDDDMSGFDGFRVATGNASDGSLSFTLDETLPDCSYYLFAQLVSSGDISEVYAEDEIENPNGALAPPSNLLVEYNTETNMFNFSWTPNPSEEVAGYILKITEETGKDSVYAMLNPGQSEISLEIDGYETKSVQIQSYDNSWNIGCPSEAFALKTDAREKLEMQKIENSLKVYPNPNSGICTIRYFVEQASDCEILIFDFSGRVIAQPLSAYQTVGTHELSFNYGQLPNGVYFISYMNGRNLKTVKSVLSR